MNDNDLLNIILRNRGNGDVTALVCVIDGMTREVRQLHNEIRRLEDEVFRYSRLTRMP